MINPNQFINLILEPALQATDTYSLDAMHLLSVTFLLESKLTHLKQLPNGPAIGFGQMEWPTYLDCCRYLEKKPVLHAKILRYLERTSLPTMQVNFMSDLSLQVLMTRVKYLMIPESIPSYKDVPAQAALYKKYYNTSNGAATVELFIKAAQDLEGYINHGTNEVS